MTVFSSRLGSDLAALTYAIAINPYLAEQRNHTPHEFEAGVCHEIAHIKNQDGLNRHCLEKIFDSKKDNKRNELVQNRKWGFMRWVEEWAEDCRNWQEAFIRFQEMRADMYAVLIDVDKADSLYRFHNRLNCKGGKSHPSDPIRAQYSRLIRDMLIEESWSRPVDGFIPTLDTLMHQAVYC